MDAEPSNPAWWRNGVFYQVYPRSFQDSNADGVGDLKGIIERLPYFLALGVDAIWLSPIFPSPMADFGYDIADYVGIDPLFGAMLDFDALTKAVHARGLKLNLSSISCRTILPTSTRGSSKAGRPATIRGAIGISGVSRV
jgi:alpha-glucosidase